MLDFEAALERMLASVAPCAFERVPLAEADGRVLARPLHALRPIPEFDYSAMDGYAVAVADLAAPGAELAVSGTSSAGSAPSVLTPGTAMRIFTGGPIPEGADAVVIQENVEREGQVARFLVLPTPGEHIRRCGEDLRAGQQALAAGVRLNAFALGLCAALDCIDVVVAERPRVSILCTGDELRLPGTPGPPGSIPESNSIVLRALIRSAGGVPLLCPSSADDPHKLREALANALELGDVAVTVGGVSVGERDLVRESLESLGCTTVFHKVAIKPGKPLYFGTFGKKPVLGLPGNPASAQLTFTLFGLSLLRAMQGMPHPAPRQRDAVLSARLEQRPGRLGFYRATLDGTRVTALPNQASGATTGTAWGNALIMMPADRAVLAAGEHVTVISLDGI
jgi:molybdopterin molybdotransferase